MMNFVRVFAFIGILLCSVSYAWGQAKRSPDSAFDSASNRYLMVWEEDEGEGEGSVIKAQFRNTDGSEGPGASVLISDPRPTQGCFYGQFDEQNGDITTSSDCPKNSNPSVAYHDGQYLVAWEVHGNATAPSSAPDNQFINIFAQIIDANTLEPLPGWEEGILISKVFIAANNAESQCGDKHACNDGQIQAWSKSQNPDVAPNILGQGFVVTWQTNKDFIGCADSERRRGWAVYGRYIDENFSATSTTNPPAFSVYKDDSTMADFCEPLSNVDNGTNPRIAVNQSSSDFAIVYEVARANGGNASIGAKRVTLSGDNVGQVSGSLMPDIVASVSGSSLNQPEVVSFKSQYVVFASDGSDIRAKGFASDSISSSEPAVLSLGGGSKVNPRAASSLGIGGERTAPNSSPERILLAYENGGDIFAGTLREDLSVARVPRNISDGMGTSNRAIEISSDARDFLASWSGQDSGEQVFVKFISSEDDATPTPTATPTPNMPPSAPGLLAPANAAVFAPTRLFLSWSASTDPDDDSITYRIYFGENVVPATPQATGVTTTNFVIGPENAAMTGITLEPNTNYQWKVEADDGQGGLTSSPVRNFSTDNSVVAWWRFDEDPAGVVCDGGGGGETVCDYSGNNNHGVPTNGPVWLPPPMVGVLGGAMNFDGVNDRIQVANSSTLNISGAISVEAFLEPNSASGVIVARDEAGNASNGNYVVLNNSLTGAVSFSFFHGIVAQPNRTYIAGATPLTAGTKQLLMIRHTFGSAVSTQVRVDNIPQAGSWTTGTGNELPVSVNNILGVAASSVDTGGLNHFDATMDEIILYEKYLTPQEADNGFLSRP